MEKNMVSVEYNELKDLIRHATLAELTYDLLEKSQSYDSMEKLYILYDITKEA